MHSIIRRCNPLKNCNYTPAASALQPKRYGTACGKNLCGRFALCPNDGRTLLLQHIPQQFKIHAQELLRYPPNT